MRLVQLGLGELAGVELELFRTAFEGCRADRGYSAASLEVVVTPAVWRCAACGDVLRAGARLRCATCENDDLTLTSGGELHLNRVELEVADV